MTHSLGIPLEDEIAKPKLNPAFAIFIDLPEPVRAWTGIGELSFGGNTYLGTGSFGSLDAVRESTDGSAIGAKVTLNGIPSEMAGDIDDQFRRGARMDVYVLAVDESWTQVVGQPKLLQRLRTDTCDINDGGDVLTVVIQGESRMREQARPTIKRYTNEYQQRRHPGDRFFEFLSAMTEVPILWAQQAQTPPALAVTSGSSTYASGGADVALTGPMNKLGE